MDGISDMKSLVGMSSVDQPLGNGSDFDQSAQNQLACSYTNPCPGKTCLWLQSTQEDACSNLTVGSTLVWERDNPGLFRTSLNFSASNAMAGKYDFTLRLPLKAKGKSTASEYNDIRIEVNVIARTCASSSAICFENKDSPGTCSSLSTGITYTQGDQLQVQVSNLRDVNGIRIASQAVDTAAAMSLKFCTPPGQSQCNVNPMKYQQEDGRFSGNLPQLTHAGQHLVTVFHGNMSGCIWRATFVSSCKVGHTANKVLECIPTEEERTEDQQVCCCWTNVY